MMVTKKCIKDRGLMMTKKMTFLLMGAFLSFHSGALQAASDMHAKSDMGKNHEMHEGDSYKRGYKHQKEWMSESQAAKLQKHWEAIEREWNKTQKALEALKEQSYAKANQLDQRPEGNQKRNAEEQEQPFMWAQQAMQWVLGMQQEIFRLHTNMMAKHSEGM